MSNDPRVEPLKRRIEDLEVEIQKHVVGISILEGRVRELEKLVRNNNKGDCRHDG